MDDVPQPKLDAKALGEWFKGGGVRGGHDGMDALKANWSKDRFPPSDQLKL